MIPEARVPSRQRLLCFTGLGLGAAPMWLVRVLFVLAVNAVPVYGVYYRGWSASTVVGLYWAENLLIAVFTCARITLHRALTRKRGHWRAGQLGTKVNDKPSTQGLLGEYATMAFVFTAAHGLFVGAFIGMGGSNHSDDVHWQFSRDQFVYGVEWIAAMLALEFAFDAFTIRRRSFAWLKAYVGQRMGRVLVMHFVIIIGMFAMMATDSPFAVLYVLIGIKTLWDLAAGGKAEAAQALPAEPPRWAESLADSVAKKGGGAGAMRAEWERARAAQIAAAREDEEVMPA